MKHKIEKLKDKFSSLITKTKSFLTTYIHTNILFMSYVLVCLFNSTLIR